VNPLRWYFNNTVITIYLLITEVIIFAKVMTMGEKQILARTIGIQNEKCG